MVAPTAVVAALAALLLAIAPLEVAAASLRPRRGNVLHSDPSQVKLKVDFPYYHTSDELSAEVQRLASMCKGATLTLSSVTEDNVAIEVVNVVRNPKPSTAVTNRVAFLSGEHARELIGPETTLRFLQLLCGDISVKSSVSAADALEDAEFMVILNGNPLSRLKVEAGEYCVRSNPNGVDLNRNWDEAWTEPMILQTDRGEKPFSEPETRLLKKLMTDFKPTLFLSVHSGTLGLYMPWAWSVDKLATRNQENMMGVMKEVDKNHCRCPYGAAGREVGYPCPGTSVDYVYDNLSAPFSFAFEVWAQDVDELRWRWQEKLENGGEALLKQGHTLAHPHFRDVFGSRSDFVGLMQMGSDLEKASEREDPSMCFPQFNPWTEELYTSTVDNWAAAYMEMSMMITKELQNKGSD